MIKYLLKFKLALFNVFKEKCSKTSLWLFQTAKFWRTVLNGNVFINFFNDILHFPHRTPCNKIVNNITITSKEHHINVFTDPRAKIILVKIDYNIENVCLNLTLSFRCYGVFAIFNKATRDVFISTAHVTMIIFAVMVPLIIVKKMNDRLLF